MSLTNDDLRSWVNAEKGRLQWLANRTRLSEGSIYNYCSTRQITPSNGILLEYAIDEYDRIRSQEEKDSVDIDISEEDKEIIERYVRETKMKLEELAAFLIDNKAKKNDAREHPIKLVSPPSFAPIQSLNELYEVEVIGNIAAGALADGETVPYSIKTDQPLANDEYVLRVNGKSMEPQIMDGSLVVMRKHTIPPIPKLGTIVEYNDERGVTLKKLAQRKTADGKKEYILKSINPTFQDILPMDGGRVSAVYVRTLENSDL